MGIRPALAVLAAVAAVGGCCFTPEGEPDGGQPDSGPLPDSGARDSGSSPDSGPPDSGPAPDSGPTDQCLIGVVAFADGAPNPTNPCETCQPAVSQTAWTAVADGLGCGRDGVCIGGKCTTGCIHYGGYFSRGELDSATCNRCLGANTWAVVPDGTPCDPAPPFPAAAVCYQNICQPGCFIDGTYYQPGTLQAPGSCLICNSYPTEWLSNQGVPCGDDGGICMGDGFCHARHCVIDGTWYADQETNPSDPSQCCNGGRDASGWTPRFSASKVFHPANRVWDLTSADRNAERQQDLFIVDDEALYLLQNQLGDLSHELQYPTGPSPSALLLADLNGDYHDDLVVANNTGASFTVFLNDGFGAYGDGTTVATGFSPSSLATGDFNSDGAADLVVNTGGIYFGDGAGGFSAPVAAPILNTDWFIAAADLRGNGIQDLVGCAMSGSPIQVALGHGDGGFDLPVIYSLSGNNLSLIDWNADGVLDILATDSAARVVNVLLGNGDGTFGGSLQIPIPEGPTEAARLDLDHDGLPDLLVLAAPFDLEFLWGTYDGGLGFALPVAFRTDLSSVQRMVVQDFNLDGALDVAIAGGGGVQIMFNNCQ